MDAAPFLKFAAFPTITVSLESSKMAMKPSSSYRILSHRYCWSIGKTGALGALGFKSSLNRDSPFPNAKPYCMLPTEDLGYFSKRRAREPVMAGKKASEGAKQDGGKYKDTIDLPKTAFSMRANSIVREPEIQKLWEQNQVFKRVADKNNGESFTLHDGPPYANGDLHIGHALNKILKDIINRYKLLQNCKVNFVPGWDCHGLPIELKDHIERTRATISPCHFVNYRRKKGLPYRQSIGTWQSLRRMPCGQCPRLPFLSLQRKAVLQSMDQDARRTLTPIKLRKKAAKFAKDTIQNQMKSFQRYGVWGDWENPYLTLLPEYEAAQIEVFGQMAINGHIYRGRKPVHWSPSSRTALAEAELEYPEGHVSKSIYAIFKLVGAPPSSDSLLEEFFPDLCLAIWTTTPWTIPANAAVAVNAELLYSVSEVHLEDMTQSPGTRKLGNVLKSEKRKPFVIVASELIPTLQSKWGVKLSVKKTFRGSKLEHYRYAHPIDNRECLVVIGGEYITTESGTGLVHTAPGHGQEDYLTGLKYGLPIISPVDDDGKFTEEADPFGGLDVLGDGNIAVVKYLDQKMSLVMEEPYKHKYPYDWRTKKPTIFRATEQWFASVEGFREAAMDAIRRVTWVPAQAEKRISAMTSSRSDWCISRQRTWGVPIPVFYHVHTKEPLMNQETIEHIKTIISERGSDAWWYMDIVDLLPSKYHDSASEYQKGTDTMDVWFDSGTSWAAVLEKRDGFCGPADLYLEGSDQHRGWFQSSLLTSIATRGRAPYSSVVTHGFVLDEKGLKMSKSLGNVVDPKIVIEGEKNNKDAPGYGADVLRLWVSSVDYTVDVMVGPQILRQISEMYRKLRGTFRYLLSVLPDWKPEYTIPFSDLPMIDQYALFQLRNVVNNIKGNYENYQFYRIFQSIQHFSIVDLSNFYFDVAKDRLYTGGTKSFTRRSCQTVLAAHLLSLVRVISPILPHLAEDVWQHLPFEHIMQDGSVAKFVSEARWPDVNEKWLTLPSEQVDFWGGIRELRTEVNKVLEIARGEKLIGSSLDAKVYLHTSNDEMAARLQEMCAAQKDADKLHHIFLTSQAEVLTNLANEVTSKVSYSGQCLIQGKTNIWIGVARADGDKCERCWHYSPQVGSFSEHPTLCSRCYEVVGCHPVATMAAVS